MIIKNEKKTVKTPIQTATRRFTPVRAQRLLFSKRVPNAHKTREKYARIPLQDKAKTQSLAAVGFIAHRVSAKIKPSPKDSVLFLVETRGLEPMTSRM